MKTLSNEPSLLDSYSKVLRLNLLDLRSLRYLVKQIDSIIIKI